VTVLIEHIRDLIAQASPTIAVVGAATGWRLGIGRITDDPDTQIVIWDAPGEHPWPHVLLDYPYFQVMVRGAPDGYHDARQKAQDVYDELVGIYPITFSSGDRLDAITVVGTVGSVGFDQRNRPLISANYRSIYEPAPSTYTHRTPLNT